MNLSAYKESTRQERLAVVAGLMVALVLGTVTARAQSQSSQASTEDTVTTVDFNGVQVAVDSKTGKLRPPTREEAKALAEALKTSLNRSSEGLRVVERPDGSKSVDLQGRFMSLAAAKVEPDGSVSETCVSSAQEADEFLRSDEATAGSANGKTTREVTAKPSRRPAEEE